MPKTIRTPQPNMELSYMGEKYESDDQGIVSMPEAAAQHFIESHSCVDPDKEHPLGLQVKALGKGLFMVVDKDDKPIHDGSVDRPTAFALVRSYKPAEPVKAKVPVEDPEKTEKENEPVKAKVPVEDPEKTEKENELEQKNADKAAERAERKGGRR